MLPPRASPSGRFRENRTPLSFRTGSQLDLHGFSFAARVRPDVASQELLAGLETAPVAGRRGLLALPGVRALAGSAPILDLVRPHLGLKPVVVRALYFDKSAAANWSVSWHQDLTLAVRARVDVPGFGPWSVKDGVPHVQAPANLLEQMLTIRLHLDDADADNGALRVLPGTHRLGRLTAGQIQALRNERAEYLCPAQAGDVLLMRPLLLHASSRSISPRNRRILHLEYAGFTLPQPLEWPAEN